MAHTLKWETNGLYRKFTGNISSDEILESNLQLMMMPEFKKAKYIINDFLEVSDQSVLPEHTKAYAKSDNVIANTAGIIKIALVADKDELIQIASSYLEIMENELFNCELFKTVEDARHWISE